jgi:hypothetical protein
MANAATATTPTSRSALPGMEVRARQSQLQWGHPMFKYLLLTVLALAILPASRSLADSLQVRSRPFGVPPLTFVQHSPEICKDGCERKYQFCVQTVRGAAAEQYVIELALDRCERNYHECVKICS